MFSKLEQLEPDEERDQARLYQYRDFVIAIWEDSAIQVYKSQKLQELEPDEERDQARLYQYKDFVIAIWEDPAIQVQESASYKSWSQTRRGTRRGSTST